jgi:hypothetical protein
MHQQSIFRESPVKSPQTTYHLRGIGVLKFKHNDYFTATVVLIPVAGSAYYKKIIMRCISRLLLIF